MNLCYAQTDLSKGLCLRPVIQYYLLKEINDAFKIQADFVNAPIEQIQGKH